MSYRLDIDEVSIKLLAEPDIRTAIEPPPAFLNDAYVRTELRNQVDSIRRAAAKEIDFFENLEHEIEIGRTEFSIRTADPISIKVRKFGTNALTRVSW